MTHAHANTLLNILDSGIIKARDYQVNSVSAKNGEYIIASNSDVAVNNKALDSSDSVSLLSSKVSAGVTYLNVLIS